ncbi:MAG: hypothetical protein ACM3ZB_01670 [bacterium]|jgi:hypothetical protein
MKTDWRAAARAFAPEVPAEQLDRIIPVLVSLEEVVRPAIEGLPLDLPPATGGGDEA